MGTVDGGGTDEGKLKRRYEPLLGKVFAKLDIDYGQSWTVTFSHELLEMLGDPCIDTLKQGRDGKLYALEVSDAVEADELGYDATNRDDLIFVDQCLRRRSHSDELSDLIQS